MALPAILQRLYSFTGFQQAQGNSAFPGTQIDTDLDQTNNALNDLTRTVGGVIRPDGKLANGSVGRNALAADLALGFGPSRPWAAGNAYVQDDTVTRGAGLYRARTASTGVDPAAAPMFWELVADLSQAVTIADDAITRQKIVTKAVGNGQIDDAAVDARVLALKSVEARHAAPSLGVVPIGTEVDFAGVTPPTNWFWTNGTQLNRFQYPALFEALSFVVSCNTTVGSTTLTNLAASLVGLGLVGATIEGPGIPAGTVVGAVAGDQAVLTNPATASASGIFVRIMPYGNGDGANTFRLPDRRGRFTAARDDMGGFGVGRLPGLAGDRLASAGGSENRILTNANLPVNLPGGSVSVSYPGHTYVKYERLDVVAPGGGTNVTNLWRNTENAQTTPPNPQTFNFGLSNPGGGQPFSVLPPAGIANRIIFAGA